MGMLMAHQSFNSATSLLQTGAAIIRECRTLCRENGMHVGNGRYIPVCAGVVRLLVVFENRHVGYPCVDRAA
jgi:hypothetical protein